ncbi:hypothetical protein O181_052015 [Austropuccinia psidii MF-1]|uniref:Uncharacterized protein n=1 Tax=Austropuccinia psidii MF-1 TaxID=1389203 RepID=A0A9Q3E438_9BASI|nr:hypothetical protein [Austropuccinia psidii MF-1]
MRIVVSLLLGAIYFTNFSFQDTAGQNLPVQEAKPTSTSHDGQHDAEMQPQVTFDQLWGCMTADKGVSSNVCKDNQLTEVFLESAWDVLEAEKDNANQEHSTNITAVEQKISSLQELLEGLPNDSTSNPDTEQVITKYKSEIADFFEKNPSLKGKLESEYDKAMEKSNEED